jgi:mono/diheme cytochrome c family protein
MSPNTTPNALRRSRMVGLAAFVAIVLVAGWGGWRLFEQDPETAAPDVEATPALIARGKYLTRVSDCAACHTRPGGEAFAGGVAFKLPFGTIYSTNITADRNSGIGTWSDDEFVRALHLGVAKDGRHLYPAFPYTSYTGMSRADAVAIKAYLFSLAPARTPVVPNRLSFPFDQRWLMAFWNIAFVDVHRFRAAPDLSEAENRGAYLATALGHCGECHTPRNFAFAMNRSRLFAGETIQGWRAYNITSDRLNGIGAWSDQEIADYLKTGHAEGRGSATGPMAEAVTDSLQYLSADDVSALVRYLRKIPAQKDGRASVQRTGAVTSDAVANVLDDLGKHLFDGNCSGCHLPNGRGRQTPYANLVGTRDVSDPTGNNVIQVVLNGADLRGVHPAILMPDFGEGLSDTEIAAIANYLIKRFSGTYGTATADDVERARAAKP